MAKHLVGYPNRVGRLKEVSLHCWTASRRSGQHGLRSSGRHSRRCGRPSCGRKYVMEPMVTSSCAEVVSCPVIRIEALMRCRRLTPWLVEVSPKCAWCLTVVAGADSHRVCVTPAAILPGKIQARRFTSRRGVTVLVQRNVLIRDLDRTTRRKYGSPI